MKMLAWDLVFSIQQRWQPGEYMEFDIYYFVAPPLFYVGSFHDIAGQPHHTWIAGAAYTVYAVLTHSIDGARSFIYQYLNMNGKEDFKWVYLKYQCIHPSYVISCSRVRN